MNIKPEQLQNSLSNQLASTYFAFGAEILLVEQSLSMIKGIARENGFNERFRFDIDGNFSWDSIISLISSPSLFAEKRIIECRLTTGKIGVKGSKALTEILETLPDDILLIISSGKLEMAQQKSKWFKTLDKRESSFSTGKFKVTNWLDGLQETCPNSVLTRILKLLMQ